MTIHFARNGQQFGPYESEAIEELLRSGTVELTDDVWHSGAAGWVSLATYLREQQPAVAAKVGLGAGASPPPIPATPPSLLKVTTGPAAAGIGQRNDPDDGLEREILAGGRFVIFSYCISALVMSFKRPSEIVYLKPGESGFGHAFGYSIVSLVAGWWGIPWGPIWTISTVFKNAHGGHDVTTAILNEKLGPARTAALLAQRGKLPLPGGWLKAWRYALYAFLTLVVANLVLVVVMALRNPLPPVQETSDSPTYSASSESSPGRAAFEAANRQIDFNRGQVAFGNTAKAGELASLISRRMKELDEAQFTGGNKNGLSASKHEFLTYCELRNNGCVVLIHVPELRRYDSDAKNALSALAWKTAQESLQASKVATPPFRLAVGVRGIALYERVMSGEYVPEFSPSKTGVMATKLGAKSREELYSLFDGPSEPATSPAAKTPKLVRKPAAPR